MIRAERKRLLYRVLMLLYLVAVCLLCFANLGNMGPQEQIWGMPTDKLAHFLLFLPFPLLAWGCTLSEKESVPRILGLILLFFLLGAALGFSTEYIQDYLPNRRRDTMDFLADLCGITAASLSLMIYKLCRPKEA